MAANYYQVSLPTLDEFLLIARELDLTLSGELFSLESLFKLAALYFPNVECAVFDLDKIITELNSNHLIIMAYDADKNHEPCLRKGHSAHWCVIHGYAYKNDKNYEDHPTSREDYFLIASHGKSQYSSLWSFKSLSESHFNLRECKPSLDSSLHKIPSNLTGLQGILCIKNKKI